MILIHQRYRQTDGRTDGQHAISIPRYALVHRAVKMIWQQNICNRQSHRNDLDKTLIIFKSFDRIRVIRSGVSGRHADSSLILRTMPNSSFLLETRKPCYRKDDRAMRPIYGCPEKFRDSSQTPPATFPEICKEFLFRSILRMCIQNLKFIALSVREIIGILKKFGQSLDTPTLHFLSNF